LRRPRLNDRDTYRQGQIPGASRGRRQASRGWRGIISPLEPVCSLLKRVPDGRPGLYIAIRTSFDKLAARRNEHVDKRAALPAGRRVRGTPETRRRLSVSAGGRRAKLMLAVRPPVREGPPPIERQPAIVPEIHRKAEPTLPLIECASDSAACSNTTDTPHELTLRLCVSDL
jgi:hypothetical protein